MQLPEYSEYRPTQFYDISGRAAAYFFIFSLIIKIKVAAPWSYGVSRVTVHAWYDMCVRLYLKFSIQLLRDLHSLSGCAWPTDATIAADEHAIQLWTVQSDW